ncbi:hypothetical protein JCM17823_21770 [Halorubrum gandharaense]
MRIKPVPEPPDDLDALREVRRAVPLIPGSTDDCCARLRNRLDLPSRQAANDWLAFLRAIGLAEETPRGFVRGGGEVTAERVREGLLSGVLLAPETHDLLSAATPEDPMTADDLFTATRESVPRHDRARDANWEETWRDRADRLLRWFMLVDLAEPVCAGSTSVSTGDPAYVAGDAA